MSFYFLDTSALVKRYHKEIGSDKVDAIFSQKDKTIVISNLTIVELISAFKRKENKCEIDTKIFNLVESKFFADVLKEFVVFELTNEHVKESVRLVRERGLRTLDALQLSITLEIKDVGCIFVSADSDLCKVAKHEGLQVLHVE